MMQNGQGLPQRKTAISKASITSFAVTGSHLGQFGGSFLTKIRRLKLAA
jgi:hypothetical protein